MQKSYFCGSISPKCKIIEFNKVLVYKKIIFIFLFSLFAVYVLNAQSSTCIDAEPFCTDAGIDFQNTTGVATSGAVGCLEETPNPSFFFLKIENDGDLFMLIEQNSAPDFTGAGLDVDFIAWGPFSQSEFQSGVCGSLNAANQVPGSAGVNDPPNTTTSRGCSYRGAATENFNIIGANAGDYFVIMITNFISAPGYIRMNIATGGGSTDCSILETTLGPDQDVCEGDFVELDATPSEGIAISYVWSLDTGSGFNVITGENGATLNPVVSGIYQVEVTDDSNNVVIDDVIVTFNTLPIATQPSPILVCDDVSNNGVEVFDLETLQNAAILNGLDPTLFTITYHESLTDAQVNTAALAMPYTSIAGSYPKTIYARIENNNKIECFDTTDFTIEVFDSALPLNASAVTLLSKCDDTSFGTDNDGFVVFNLEDRETDILNGQLDTDFTLTYFTDSSYTSQILTPNAFSNTIINGQTIYVRMTNNSNSNCFADTSFEIEVYKLPVVTPNVSLIQCDDDNDGRVAFNLTEANTLISTNVTNELFTYYLTQSQADTGLVADQISNFTSYSNLIPLTGTVYVRIENANRCHRTARIDLVVGATQIPSAFNIPYNECDNKFIDNDNTNGIATFDFSDAEAQILALFPPGNTVSYYTNLTDALAENNAILDTSNYRNDGSPFVQNIYVRIDSDIVNACLGLGEHITLTVDPLPLANTIPDYVLCSDTNLADFDLTTKDAEVRGSQTQAILISYHTSLNDAENNVLPLTTLTNASAQTIYVRAQFDDNANGVGDAGECINTDMLFDLVVIPNPIIFEPDPIIVCNNQVNTVYDLTLRTDQITGGDATIALTYFETQTDLDNNNPIVNPTTFNNTLLDNTVLVLATGTNTCTSIVNMELKTIIYDILNLSPTLLEECEVDNDGFDDFDLRRRETEILNTLNPSDFIFTYYENEVDAIAGNNNTIQDPTRFVNTEKITQTIYVRIDPIANECFQIAPLELIVNPVPEIQINDRYVICLAPDGSITPPVGNIFLPAPPIDTRLNPLDFSFQWYEGTEGLPEGLILGETNSTFTPIKEGYYTVIATNLISGCTIPATTLVIGSYPPESILLEATTDAFSNNDILKISIVGNGIYEYSLDNGLWQESSTFENVVGGEHTVRVRDIYNCDEFSDTIIVMDYPRFFTPNGDGFNDTWQIHGIAGQYDADIYIYDRFGKLIKQLNPKSTGWNGTFNGIALPSDDYWFTVEFNEPNNSSTRREFRAHFTLKR